MWRSEEVKLSAADWSPALPGSVVKTRLAKASTPSDLPSRARLRKRVFTTRPPKAACQPRCPVASHPAPYTSTHLHIEVPDHAESKGSLCCGSSSSILSPGCPMLCTPAPSRRTGRRPASVLVSRRTARSWISSGLLRGRARVAARDGAEVLVAHLDRDRPRDKAVVLEPLRVLARHDGDLLTNAVDVDQVVRVRALARGRFRRAIRLDRAIVLARRELQQPVGHAADRGTEHGRIRGPHVDEPGDAVIAQPLLGHRADAPERVDRQLLQKRLDTLGRDHGQAIGLAPRRGNFREELVRRDARRRRESRVVSESAPSISSATLTPSGSFHAFSVTSR